MYCRDLIPSAECRAVRHPVSTTLSYFLSLELKVAGSGEFGWAWMTWLIPLLFASEQKFFYFSFLRSPVLACSGRLWSEIWDGNDECAGHVV